MKSTHRAMINAKPEQFEAAKRAAWLRSRDLTALLGLEKTRDPIVEVAALRAIGAADASLTRRVWAQFDDDEETCRMVGRSIFECTKAAEAAVAAFAADA